MAVRLDHESEAIESAIAELQGLILARFPTTTFEISAGDDPEGIYITATVDVDDTDTVFDVVVDRIVDLQVEEGLPVYVMLVRTPERIAQSLRALHAAQSRGEIQH